MDIKMKDVKIEDVVWVYSGHPFRCCCGCSGKYTFSEKHRVFAGEIRGYEVNNESVNDRSVKMMLTKMKKLYDVSEVDEWTHEKTKVFSIDTPTRLYMMSVILEESK